MICVLGETRLVIVACGREVSVPQKVCHSQTNNHGAEKVDDFVKKGVQSFMILEKEKKSECEKEMGLMKRNPAPERECGDWRLATFGVMAFVVCTGVWYGEFVILEGQSRNGNDDDV
mmetsp:Transcript_874/g.2108  ORF Transcript_874/g.2108 Transcript_874/m.2108 type:complete len:117 (-) Transcript_874:506-856(-)